MRKKIQAAEGSRFTNTASKQQPVSINRIPQNKSSVNTKFEKNYKCEKRYKVYDCSKATFSSQLDQIKIEKAKPSLFLFGGDRGIRTLDLLTASQAL